MVKVGLKPRLDESDYLIITLAADTVYFQVVLLSRDWRVTPLDHGRGTVRTSLSCGSEMNCPGGSRVFAS